jgi:hypothetical protein
VSKALNEPRKKLTRGKLWSCAFRKYPTEENPNALEYTE